MKTGMRFASICLLICAGLPGCKLSQAQRKATATQLAATTTATVTPTLLPTPTSELPVPGGTSVPIRTASILPDNASRVTQRASWGKGTATGVVFSPDGKLVAFASSLGIYLYDAQDLTELRLIETGTWVDSVAFSSDSQTLASGSRDGIISLWRVSDGNLLRTLKGHMGSMVSVAFSPDGQTLASGSDDEIIRLWRISDGSLLRTLEGHLDVVYSVAFSPDGQTLASGSWDNTIRLWQRLGWQPAAYP